MPKRPMGDVIVLLPGILGSVLQHDGKDVWAIDPGAALRAVLTLGNSIKQLKLDTDPPDLEDLGDGITAPRLQPDLHLIPGLWKIDGYGKIEAGLFASYQLEPGKNYFPFPYDWRRDNRVHAQRLARESEKWLADWKAESGNTDAKLVLIGHSMGGLVARHFLEVLDGWRNTRALITFGTPYRGSINAIDFLAHGMRKKLGPITLIDLTDMLRSFTSVYQLLPEYACVDAGNGLVHLNEAPPIAGMDPAKVDAALAFHHTIADHATAHAGDDEYLRNRYAVHPIVGIRQETSQSVRLDNGNVEALATYEGVDTDGDGTVPMQSATPIEWIGKSTEMYAAERHASLQNFDAVLVQVDGLLRNESVHFRAPELTLGLGVDDLYQPAEPVAISVRADRAGVDLTAVVTEHASGKEMSRASGRSDGDWCRLELPPLPSGTYRLELSGVGVVMAQPVHDVFVVFDAGDVDRAAAGG